jgi:hypothetical protein
MIILMLCAPFLFIGGIVLTVVVLLNIFGGEPGYFGKFDAAATIYNDGEYAEFADEWLEAGVVLANDLNSADTPETTKQQIEARLEKLRGTINWTQLDPIEREDWFRIDSAIRLRHIQEAQIQDIANKRHCLAIVASSANPETGEFNFGQPEGTCP